MYDGIYVLIKQIWIKMVQKIENYHSLMFPWISDIQSLLVTNRVTNLFAILIFAVNSGDVNDANFDQGAFLG